MTRRIRLNAFDMNCVGHQSPGLWAHPRDKSWQYKDLEYWTGLAQTLERGIFDGIFIADVLGVYDVYKGSAYHAIQQGAQIPVNDPLQLVPAMAVVTKHLGFGITASISFEHPYPFARRMSTIDHLTKGRVGWNVVTSYLDSGARNLGQSTQVAHNDRYDVADEYLEVLYKLWEGSWEEGAVVRDREARIFAHPDKVHEIGHKGRFFEVPGYHLSEPSPQRSVVIYQAGASSRGKAFAAEHAECVFVAAPTKTILKAYVADIRRRAAAAGRYRDTVVGGLPYGLQKRVEMARALVASPKLLLLDEPMAGKNLTQALRAHFGFTEDVLTSRDPGRRERWLDRIGRGDMVGGAWSEVGDAKLAAFSTRVSGSGRDLRLDGTKYYTTGSLFADWIDVGATDAADEGIGVVVSRHAPGVEILDDWDGVGQALTASGTAIFTRAPVQAADITKADTRFGYAPAFFQLVQLATIAGIARALANELATAVAKRARTYTHAAASRPSEDPQVLQVVGRVRGAAYTAGAIVLKVAEAVQRAADLRADPEAFATAVHIADLESAQAQSVVIDLVLQAATIAFDALGASAVKRDAGLDRHWRNARTLASHNPRIYKDRIVGDYAVNGTPPPAQWRVGRS